MYVNHADGAGIVVAVLFFTFFIGGMLLGIIDDIRIRRKEKRGEAAVRDFLVRNGFDPDSEGGQKVINKWCYWKSDWYDNPPDDKNFIEDAYAIMDDAWQARREEIENMTPWELEKELELPYGYLDKFPSDNEFRKFYTEANYQIWNDAWDHKYHKLSEPIKRNLWRNTIAGEIRRAKKTSACTILKKIEYPQYTGELKFYTDDSRLTLCHNLYLKTSPRAQRVMKEQSKAAEKAKVINGDIPLYCYETLPSDDTNFHKPD